MLHVNAPFAASSQQSIELETALAAVEEQLSALGAALVLRDTGAIDQHASELHRSLAFAVRCFALAARRGGVPPHLRQRLALAGGKVAAQRESLARATAALDRAIDVLMPDAGPSGVGVYAASGSAERAASIGTLQA
jgi:hypothetical protein